MRFLRILVIILLFAFIALICVHSLNSINQDIGRHLKSGEIIWQTKSVYKTNLFSFTEPGHPFINHHWLSEVVFYLLNAVIGLKGLIFFKAGVITMAFVLIWLAVYRTSGFGSLLFSSFLGLFVFIVRADVRPEIFSYLFLSVFICAIFKAKYENRFGLLYALPLIQILWTNMHIYFALGPVLILFLLVDSLIHRKNKKIAGKIFIIVIASVLTTLINPSFLRGALQPLTILTNYGYGIVENQSVFFLQNYGAFLGEIAYFQITAIILLISFLAAFKLGRRKMTLEILLAVFFVILGGKMFRNFGPYALAFIPVLSLNLSAIKLPGSLNADKIKISAHLLLLALLFFLIWQTAHNNFYKSSSRQFGPIIPEGAAGGVEFVKENNIKGPVFNNFDVGSFLIWKLYPVPSSSTSYGTSPEFRVFVDGRPEAYSVDFFEKIYKPMMEDPSLWKKYSEIYKINYVFIDHRDITPWARKFLFYISQNPDWPLVYKDSSVVVFLKRTPENSALIKKCEIK